MGIQIDWINELILITSSTTAVDLQSLHDLVEDERGMASPVGLIRSAILTPEGKIEDPTNPGVYSQIILVMQSPWQIQFWGGSGYTRVYGGKIVGGLNDQPIKATGTAGDVTVLESPVDGVYVAPTASIPPTTDEIADAIWDSLIADYTISGTFGESLGGTSELLTRILGLVQENFFIDQTSYTEYQDQKLMTGGRIRIYDNAASVGTDSDVLATYTITSNWTNDEMDDYQVKKV